MKIDFRVHNATVVPYMTTVEHQGAQVPAELKCLEVELVTVNDAHGSLTLRFVAAEMEEAKAKFVPDATVSWVV